MSRVLCVRLPNRPAPDHASPCMLAKAGLLALGLAAGEFAHATGDSLPIHVLAESQKVSVDLTGRDQGRRDQPMRYHYWLHYLASGGYPKLISARGYEDLTAPVHYEVAVEGWRQPHK